MRGMTVAGIDGVPAVVRREPAVAPGRAGAGASVPGFLRRSLLPAVLLIVMSSPGRAARDAGHDVVVYGGTPAGVVCAVRAAREGLSVLLVTPFPHLGGALANGLTTMDTLYNGARAPLYDEIRRSIHDHYRTTYGEHSEQYHRSMPGTPKTKTESRVFEELVTALVAAEKRIEVVRGFGPDAVEVDGATLRTIRFRSLRTAESFTASGRSFVDCSYEGDVAAAARVPYRVGREGRDEFDEPHAGRIFMSRAQWPAPAAAAAQVADVRRLNLVHYDRWYDILRPASTGAADDTVQAYNLRTILTRDPSNRVPIAEPEGYDPEQVRRRIGNDVNWVVGPAPSPNQPNAKTYLNLPEIVGAQRDYPEGDWDTRRRIVREHAELTLALVYFMQNDPSVPAEIRAGWRDWGLPRDEFADSGHLPREIYVREARRIVGRAGVFTEHDARLAPGLERAPIHADAVSVTDWFLDSHACTPEHVPGSMFEGEFLLNHLTYPGQISYGTMLPQGVDNLLVPVCVSATHVGWGAIRLEPTWMSLAEAAAHAVVIGRRAGLPPAAIDADVLVRALADRGVMLSFFNDVEVDPREPWYPAIQYFGTQGFFGSYEADPLDAVTDAMADAWIEAAVEWMRGERVDLTRRARRMLVAQAAEASPLTGTSFLARLSSALTAAGLRSSADELLREVRLAPEARLSRGNACRLLLAARRIAAGE